MLGGIFTLSIKDTSSHNAFIIRFTVAASLKKFQFYRFVIHMYLYEEVWTYWSHTSFY